MPDTLSSDERRERGMRAVKWMLFDVYGIQEGGDPKAEAFAEKVVDTYAKTSEETPTLAPSPNLPMPWRLRIPYAWRALHGMIRPVSDIDTSQLEETGWVEGRVRVQMRKVKGY